MTSRSVATRFITLIIGIGAQIQVRWIAAGRVVALMTNMQAVWNRASGKFPCDTMRMDDDSAAQGSIVMMEDQSVLLAWRPT